MSLEDPIMHSWYVGVEFRWELIIVIIQIVILLILYSDYLTKFYYYCPISLRLIVIRFCSR